MTLKWAIVATNDYLRQFEQLDIETQSTIALRWTEVAKEDNPRSIGRTTSCPQGKPFVLVIFSGLPFEFIYKIDSEKKVILLINCERLTFLDHGQPDVI